jgi:hypothetical protein
MSFTRRPFLASQTDVPVITQPTIYGTAHVDNDGLIPAVEAVIGGSATDLELSIETDVGQLDVEFIGVTELPLADIVDTINNAAASSSDEVSASAKQGVLVLKSPSSGQNAFVRILAVTSGNEDLAPLLGFARHPHPAATVTAGDLGSSSPRAMTQGNRPLSSFLARGEDRTSESFNRALHSLSKNLDAHQFQITRGVATPVVLNIPSGSLRFAEDATTGVITRVDLRTGFSDSLDTVLARDIFVGIADDAELTEIASCFAVLDSDDNEILAGDRVVRIGTVAYVPSSGSIGGASTFDPSTEALDTALSTSATFDSYRNVLGHESTKHSSVLIDEIIDGSTIICSMASFITNGVEEGDLVYISGSGTSSPQSNDGTFVVDVVVSGTEIIVRPADADSGLRLLNEASGESLVVKSNGQFEDSLVLWFEPALPRVPASGLRLIVGMHSSVAELDPTALLIPALNSAEEVDGWVLKNLHRNLNLDGVYQGQGQDKGGGHFAKVTHRPIILHSEPVAASNTLVRSGSDGDIIAGNRLEVDAAETFTLEDVGRSIYFTMGADTYSDWRITRLIDARTVELTPPPHEIGTALTPGEVDNWDIYDELFTDFPAAISSITESSTAGGFHVTKVGTTSKDLSFAHFEQLTRSMVGGSVNSNLATMSGGFSGNVVSTITDSTGAPVDPVDIWSLYAAGRSDGRTSNRQGFRSFVRILNGVDAGLYEIKSISAGELELISLDGTTPSFTDAAVFAIYTLRMGVGVPVFGADETGSVGLDVFQRQDPSVSAGNHQVYAIRAGWEGTGAGVLVTANDDSFEALGITGIHSVARGPSIEIEAYAPAYGIDILVAGLSSDGTPVGRGQSGVRVVSDTYGHDLSAADSSRDSSGHWRSSSVLAEQAGKDPTAVFVKTTESSPSSSDELYPSCVVIEDWGSHSGAGRGAYVHGDFYSSDTTGLYFGSSLTGDAVYPRVLEDENETTILGSPELVEEISSTDVEDADFSVFNVSHDFIVSGSFVTEPARLVGLRIKSGLPGSFFTFEGVIIAAKAGVVAVRRLDSGLNNPPLLSTPSSIVGNRWWQAYVNIGNFCFVGTGISPSSRGNADLGLFYAGQRLFERGDFVIDPTEAARTVEKLSAVQGSSDPLSERVGQISPSEVVSGVDEESYSSYSSAVSWTTSVFGPDRDFFYQTPWENSTGGVAPIASHLLIHKSDGDGSTFGSADHPSAVVSDFALLNGDFFTASTRWGGSIQAGILSGSGVVSIFKKLQSYRLKQVSYKVTCRVAVAGSSDTISVSLMYRSRGDSLSLLDTILVTEEHTLTTGYNSGDIEKFEVYLSNYTSELRTAHTDFLSGDEAINSHILGIRVSVSACQTLTLVELSVEEVQLPQVHVGPVVVQGSHQAVSYRYTDARRGFDSISPSRTHFLSGVDFGIAGNLPHPQALGAFGDTAYSEDAYHAPHEGHNQPWIFYDGTSSTISPDFDPATTFYRGVGSLAIYGQSTAFDPVGLVYKWRQERADDISESPLDAVFPGKTGFVGDIDVPHGSLLSTLAISISVRPTIPLNHDDGVTRDFGWGIYNAIGYSLSSSSDGIVTFDDMITASRDKWEDAAGVKVSVWRHRLSSDLPIGVHTDSKITESLSGGYSERIATKLIYLNAVNPEDFVISPAFTPASGFNSYYALKEQYVRENIDLSVLVSDIALLKVDRRFFSYSFTIEFYIGIREYNNDGDIISVLNGTHIHPTSGFFQGETIYPPVVKFRGLQVGYLTDRAGNGGW